MQYHGALHLAFHAVLWCYKYFAALPLGISAEGEFDD
jgi:hypothetical protein